MTKEQELKKKGQWTYMDEALKPIIKKYHSKDLNIAYNDGIEQGKLQAQKEFEENGMWETPYNLGKQEAIKQVLEILENEKQTLDNVERLETKFWCNGWNDGLNHLIALLEKEFQSQQENSKLTLSQESSGLVSQPADTIQPKQEKL